MTKLDQLKTFASANDWKSAILLAAKFQQLGGQRDAILSAREGYLRPSFQRQIGKDPEQLKAAGIAAVKDRYNV